MLKHNLKYKLIALAIALAIWGYADIGQNQNISTELASVPLEMRNLGPGYVVTSAPKTVKVVIEGRRENMDTIAEELYAVTAYADLRGATVGHNALPVRVSLPSGFKHLVRAKARQEQVSVVLAEKVQRMLKVEMQFVRATPAGYQYGPPEFSPGRAVVSGLASAVEKVSRLVVVVDTGESTASSVDGDFSITALDSEDRPVQNIEITPPKVHLQMALLEAPASRAVYVSPDVVGHPPFPYEVNDISVDPQTVTLSGRPELLSKFTTLKTQPVSLNSHTKSFAQDAEVIVPSGLTLISRKPVKVMVEIAPSSDSQMHGG